MVLVGGEDEADLVYVIAVQVVGAYHASNEAFSRCLRLIVACSFALGVGHHGSRGLFYEPAVYVHAAVCLEIEAEVALVAPVHDVLHLLDREGLVHHHFAGVLHISAVCANHAVEFGEVTLCDFRLGAAGADVHLMSVCARELHGLLCRIGTLGLIVDESAVDVQKHNLTHEFSSHRVGDTMLTRHS